MVPAFNITLKYGYSTEKAASFLGVPKRSVIHWIEKGWLMHHKTGANIRIKKEYLIWFKQYKLQKIRKGNYQQDAEQLRKDLNRKRGWLW